MAWVGERGREKPLHGDTGMVCSPCRALQGTAHKRRLPSAHFPSGLRVCPASFSMKLSFDRSPGPEQLEMWAQRGLQASVPVGISEGLFLE